MGKDIVHAPDIADDAARSSGWVDGEVAFDLETSSNKLPKIVPGVTSTNGVAIINTPAQNAA